MLNYDLKNNIKFNKNIYNIEYFSKKKVSIKYTEYKQYELRARCKINMFVNEKRKKKNVPNS